MHVKFTHRKHGLRARCDVKEIPTHYQCETIDNEIRKEIEEWEKEYGDIDEGVFQAICHTVLAKHIPVCHNTEIATFEF